MGGLDGVTYHASTWIPGAFLSGSAWSPKPGTVPADFVAMEEALRAFAESKDPGARSKAHADVKARAKRLAARVKTPPNAED